MIEPRQWQGLSGLMFTAKTLVDGLYTGGHASPRHGAGIEFHDYRPYTPGDDPAAIDWKLYGRTDRYYLRRHQRYTDLHAHVVVDVSGSMGYTPVSDPKRTKLGVANELAAAIAFLGVRQRDRVGLALAGEALEGYVEPGGTWAHLMRLCRVLEGAQAGQRPADLSASLKQVHALAKRRGLVVVVSDLLDDPSGLFDGLARLRHDRFEVIVLQVLTPEELDLAALGAGRLKLLDMEGPSRIATHVPSTAARYRQAIEAHVDRVRAGCLAHGGDHVLVRTDRPALEALRRYLSRRAARV